MKIHINTLRVFLVTTYLLTSCSNITSKDLTPTLVPTIQVTQPHHTAMPTEIKFPTLTPLPNLTTDNALDIMKTFLKNNGGCQLPCLFGLTPKTSSPISVNALIEYFQKNTMQTESLIVGQSTHEASGGVFLIFRENGKQVLTNMSYYYDDSGELDILTLSAASDFIDTSSQPGDFYKNLDIPYGLELLQYYSLSNVLTLYGQPSRILIASFPTDPNRPLESYPFTMVLYYKEKGILVEYTSQRETQDNYFMGCQPTSFITVASWYPDEQKSLSDVVIRIGKQGGINKLNIDFFKDLEEVTDLTISEFYEAFKTLAEPKCVLTPKELWPEPVLNP